MTQSYTLLEKGSFKGEAGGRLLGEQQSGEITCYEYVPKDFDLEIRLEYLNFNIKYFRLINVRSNSTPQNLSIFNKSFE